MAVTLVTLSPGLRAWAAAGVSHILLDVPVSEFFVLARSGLRETEEPFSREGARAERMKENPAASVRDTSPALSAGGMSPSVPASPVKAAFPAHNSISQDMWPEGWLTAFSRTRPASILWTYHELGLDLQGGAGSQERGALLKQIIGGLSLPKGSSVFWPSAIPAAGSEEPELMPNATVFFSGVDLLHPQILVVLGPRAAGDIGLDAGVAPFSQRLIQGRLFLFLPEFGDLLSNSSSAHSVISFLRAAFSSISF